MSIGCCSGTVIFAESVLSRLEEESARALNLQKLIPSCSAQFFNPEIVGKSVYNVRNRLQIEEGFCYRLYQFQNHLRWGMRQACGGFLSCWGQMAMLSDF